MFRLNGDIIKQLENIYGIKFKNKYRNELKERIISFIDQKLICSNSISLTLSNIEKHIVINDNKLSFIKMNFIKENQEELLNFFNPIWYIDKKVEKHFSAAEKFDLLTLYMLLEAPKLEEKFISVKEVFDFDSVDHNILETKKNISFSNKMYKDMFDLFENGFYRELYNSYLFTDFDDERSILSIWSDIFNYIDSNSNFDEFENFIKDIFPNREDLNFSLFNGPSEHNIMIDIFYLYYVNKLCINLEQKIKKI